MTTSFAVPNDSLFVNDFEGSPLSSSDPLLSRRTNALSNKLTTVLSSSYADSETRTALRLLDTRDLQSLEGNRHDLKAEAQKEVIDTNARIVEDFGQVAEQLRRVGTLITTLNKTCEDIRKHVVAAKRESDPVLEEATILISRKRETEAKQQLLDVFCQHFLISDADLTTLTSSAESLNENFFVVLGRVKQIHKDCEILLGYENQRLGLELMEQTSRSLDGGFKKLYNWIQREFKGLDLEDPHISGSIRRALRVLSERPTLFQNCLDFFAEARESTLAEAFQAALTGSNSANTKAIEFSTHDPLRYVGDMLAWVHSAAVSEKEALEGLFVSDADEISKGLSAGKTNEPWARVGRRPTDKLNNRGEEIEEDEDIVFDGRKALSELVGRNLASVGQTLQHRVDIAVRSSGDPVLMYQVYNLLTFYHSIFSKLMGADVSLTKIVADLETSTLGRFEESMEEETMAATTDNTPNADLSPPGYLTSSLKHFQDICRARGPQMTTAELERLFTAMLSTPLNACAEGAMQLAETRQNMLYKINYLTALRTVLRTLAATVPSVSIPLEKANKETISIRDRLVEYIATSLLEDSGVNILTQEIDARKDPNDRREWLMTNLDEAGQRLDVFLSSALMDTQDSLNALTDKTLVKEVVAGAVERFCAKYDDLEDMLNQIEDDFVGVSNKERDDVEDEERVLLRDLYPRTGAEVRALLS